MGPGSYVVVLEGRALLQRFQRSRYCPLTLGNAFGVLEHGLGLIEGGWWLIALNDIVRSVRTPFQGSISFAISSQGVVRPLALVGLCPGLRYFAPVAL